MRISDWSSDVCSSDLTPRTAVSEAGATPMAQRVAVLGLLNKRNGESRDITLQPGQAVRVGDVIVRLRACEETASWEQAHYTGAFVQLDVRQLDQSRSEEHTSELQSLISISHAVSCLKPNTH